VVLVHLFQSFVDYLEGYFLEEVHREDLVPYLLILEVGCWIADECC
jgi:hypothetical protein